jgi:predicted ATPase
MCSHQCSAVKYSESAISYLDPSHWETHHDLMLGAHQTSILALYSCATQSRDQFQKRVDAVFANASSLDEEFVARHAWIRFISVTSPQTAISECHKVLERLREPISLDTSPADACSELVRVKNAFKEKKQISNFMVHPEKLKAMKIMATMYPFYFFQRNRIALLVSSRMVELSMEYGCCEDSFFALASFGALLVTILGDIDEGCSWSRMTLQLLSSSRYNINLIIPRVVRCAVLL